jgi:cytochrome c peroxidase
MEPHEMKPNASNRKRAVARIACAAISVACALLPWASTADEGGSGKPVFTDSELKIILSHGPWPAPAPLDATNRVSGKREAIDFGTRLFFDQRLSGPGTTSCANCHIPERNWTDNLRRGVGVAEVDRNTPTLANLMAGRWFGWDGAADSLWSQSLRPMLDQRELAATPRHVAQLIRNDEQMSCRYRKAFGSSPSPTDDDAVFVNVGKALAAFQETLTSGRTPFDQFRDALVRGAPSSTWSYSEAAQRGLKLFIGKGGCTNCHAGPNFTNGEFFSTGLSQFAPLGKPDPGRQAGIQQLLESRFNLLGGYNDDRAGTNTMHVRQVAATKETLGEFKVPSLRNLLLTSPYGRDGSVDTLAAVVGHYANRDPIRMHAKDGLPMKPLNLTAREQTDLVVFLESLSTFTNPWRPEDSSHCY